jgi:osmoprotectant transport system permease protein
MSASILTVALALVLDLILAGVGRLLTPWTKARAS